MKKWALAQIYIIWFSGSFLFSFVYSSFFPIILSSSEMISTADIANVNATSRIQPGTHSLYSHCLCTYNISLYIYTFVFYPSSVLYLSHSSDDIMLCCPFVEATMKLIIRDLNYIFRKIRNSSGAYCTCIALFCVTDGNCECLLITSWNIYTHTLVCVVLNTIVMLDSREHNKKTTTTTTNKCECGNEFCLWQVRMYSSALLQHQCQNHIVPVPMSISAW